MAVSAFAVEPVTETGEDDAGLVAGTAVSLAEGDAR